MVKIKRVRTADARGGRVPLRQGGGHRRLADPRHVRRRRRAPRRRPHIGLQGQGEARADRAARALPTGERGSGEPSRWKSDEELVWEGLRPELSSRSPSTTSPANRIRHGAKFVRWRDDKDPSECDIAQLRGCLILISLLAPSTALAQAGMSYRVPRTTRLPAPPGRRRRCTPTGCATPTGSRSTVPPATC